MTDSQQAERGEVLLHEMNGGCVGHDSTSCVEIPVSVGSTLMTRIIKRDFQKTSQNIHFVSIYGRTLSNKKTARWVESCVAKNIKNSLSEIAEMMEHVEVLIRDNSISELASYQSLHVETVRITTSLDKEFIDLIHLADRYLLLAHTLQKNGVIDDGQYSLYREVIERKVKSVNESARRMRQVIAEKINEQKKGTQ